MEKNSVKSVYKVLCFGIHGKYYSILAVAGNLYALFTHAFPFIICSIYPSGQIPRFDKQFELPAFKEDIVDRHGSAFVREHFLTVIFKDKLPVDYLYLKAGLLLAAGLVALYVLYLKRKNTNLIFTLAVMLLLSRISFNLFLVPYRQIISWPNLCRQDAIRLARGTMGEKLYLLTDTITIPNAYYITRERNEILRFKETYTQGPYYIIEDTAICAGPFQYEYVMRIPMNEKSFFAGKFAFNPKPKP